MFIRHIPPGKESSRHTFHMSLLMIPPPKECSPASPPPPGMLPWMNRGLKGYLPPSLPPIHLIIYPHHALGP